MPEFIGTAKVKYRYDYDYDRDDTEKYTETLIIEAKDAAEAEELIRMHYQALNHEYPSHNYQLRDLRISQRMDAEEVRRRHASVMADWDESYGKDYDGRKED